MNNLKEYKKILEQEIELMNQKLELLQRYENLLLKEIKED